MRLLGYVDCLSRVPGDWYARFCGEGVIVILPPYPTSYRYGARISTGFVESTVNQVISKRFCKKQQMQWTKRGAHLLLQTRVKTLNQELGAVFQRWYPDLQLDEEPLAA
jgi:hypothetical protein